MDSAITRSILAVQTSAQFLISSKPSIHDNRRFWPSPFARNRSSSSLSIQLEITAIGSPNHTKLVPFSSSHRALQPYTRLFSPKLPIGGATTRKTLYSLLDLQPFFGQIEQINLLAFEGLIQASWTPPVQPQNKTAIRFVGPPINFRPSRLMKLTRVWRPHRGEFKPTSPASKHRRTAADRVQQNQPWITATAKI